MTLASATSTTIDRTLTTGATYRFRVRATDFEGNTSGYQYGPTFKAVRFQEIQRDPGLHGHVERRPRRRACLGRPRQDATTSTIGRVLFSNAA